MRRFAGCWGIPNRNLPGTAWAELTHPDDLAPFLRWVEQWRLEPEACRDVEKRYIHRNGNVVWGRVRISLVRDCDGNPLCRVVHVEDITERKRAEEALHESEERFRMMADSCPSMMWVTDAEGGCTSSLTGRTGNSAAPPTNRVEGGKWQLLLHPDDAPEYIGAFQRAVREHTLLQGRSARPACRWRVAVDRLVRGAALIAGR